MQISRIKIVNFANFANFDVETSGSLVVVGEDKVGKSNFIRALQLILDPGLSERDHQLDLEHFWDGLGGSQIGATIEVAVELTDFTGDPRVMAHLGDCVIDPGPPMVARLTYRFQPKASLGRAPESLANYEYVIFGGGNPDMSVGASLRRTLPLDVHGALRDAEKDLATWRRSPLRPLIEELTTSLDEVAREEIQELVNQAQIELATRAEILTTAERIGDRLIEIAGDQHAIPISLGLAPTRIDALLRGDRSSYRSDGQSEGRGRQGLWLGERSRRPHRSLCHDVLRLEAPGATRRRRQGPCPAPAYRRRESSGDGSCPEEVWISNVNKKGQCEFAATSEQKIIDSRACGAADRLRASCIAGRGARI